MRTESHENVKLVSVNSEDDTIEENDEFKKLVSLQAGLANKLGDDQSFNEAERKLKELSNMKEEEPRLSFVFSHLKKLTKIEAEKQVMSREDDYRVSNDLNELLDTGVLSEQELLQLCKWFVDRCVACGFNQELSEEEMKLIKAIECIAETFEQNANIEEENNDKGDSSERKS